MLTRVVKQSVNSLGSNPSCPTKHIAKDHMEITIKETQTNKLKTRPAKTVSIEIRTDEPHPKVILEELLIPALSALGYNEAALAKITFDE